MERRTPTRMIAVDLERCLSCKSCELACAKAHAGFEDIVEAILAEVHLVPRVRVIAAAGKAVPIQCQHCEDAPCVAICPSGALYHDEERGTISAAPEKCIGCKNCILVCPFGAVDWERESASVIKCDLCQDLIAPGEEPFCVTACPTGARRLVQVEEVSASRRREAAERTVLLLQSQQQSSAQ